jgi:hypothetical protein
MGNKHPLLIGLSTAWLLSFFSSLRGNLILFISLPARLGCILIDFLLDLGMKKQRITANGVFVWFTAAIICVCALPGCADRSGRPVRVILPDGYKGKFSIIKDKAGEDLIAEDGCWVFRIPASGVLRIKDNSPFFVPHREEFLYSDSTPLPVKSLGASPGTIQTGPNSGEGSTDYDGTTHEWMVIDKRN